MNLNCKHKWKIIDKSILPSAWEQQKKENSSYTSGTYPAWAFIKKYICILQCSRCGKLNKTITENSL